MYKNKDFNEYLNPGTPKSKIDFDNLKIDFSKVGNDPFSSDIKAQNFGQNINNDDFLESDFLYNGAFDPNELRAQRQPWASKFGKGVTRLGAKIVLEAVKTVGAVGGLAAAPFADGDWTDTAFRNSFIKALEGAEEYLNDELIPIYAKKAVTEGNLWENLTSIDFWSTEGADGVGFIVAMLAPGAALKVLNVGNIVAGTTARTSRYLNTVLGKSKYMDDAVKSLNRGGKHMFPKTINAKNLDVGITATFNTISEAGLEAGHAMKDWEEDLERRRFLDPSNKEYVSPEEYDHLLSKKGEIGRNVFLANTAILAGPNLIVSNFLYGKSATKSLLNNKNRIAKEALPYNLKTGATTKLGKVQQGLSNSLTKFKHTNFRKVIDDYGQAFLREGFWEEGMQDTSSKYFQEMAAGEYEGENPFASFLSAYADTVMSVDGQKAIFLGGAFGGTMQARVNSMQRKQDKKQHNKIAEFYNERLDQFQAMLSGDLYLKENGKIKFETRPDGTTMPVIDPVKVKENLEGNLASLALQFQIRHLMETNQVEKAHQLLHKNLIALVTPFTQSEMGTEILKEFLEKSEVTENVMELTGKSKEQAIKEILDVADSIKDGINNYIDYSESLINFNEVAKEFELTGDQVDLIRNQLQFLYSNLKGSENYFSTVLSQKNELLDKVLLEKGLTRDVLENSESAEYKKLIKDTRAKEALEDISEIEESLKNTKDAIEEIWDGKTLKDLASKRAQEIRDENEANKEKQIPVKNEETPLTEEEKLFNEERNAVIDILDSFDLKNNSTIKNYENALNAVNKFIASEKDADGNTSTLSYYDAKDVIEYLEERIAKKIIQKESFLKYLSELEENFKSDLDPIQKRINAVRENISKKLEEKKKLGKNISDHLEVIEKEFNTLIEESSKEEINQDLIKESERLINELEKSIEEQSKNIEKLDKEIERLTKLEERESKTLEEVKKRFDEVIENNEYIQIRSEQLDITGLDTVEKIVKMLRDSLDEMNVKDHRLDANRLMTHYYSASENVKMLNKLIEDNNLTRKELKDILDKYQTELTKLKEYQDTFNTLKNKKASKSELNKVGKEIGKLKSKIDLSESTIKKVLKLEDTLKKLEQQEEKLKDLQPHVIAASLKKEIDFWTKIKKSKYKFVSRKFEIEKADEIIQKINSIKSTKELVEYAKSLPNSLSTNSYINARINDRLKTLTGLLRAKIENMLNVNNRNSQINIENLEKSIDAFNSISNLVKGDKFTLNSKIFRGFVNDKYLDKPLIFKFYNSNKNTIKFSEVDNPTLQIEIGLPSINKPTKTTSVNVKSKIPSNLEEENNNVITEEDVVSINKSIPEYNEINSLEKPARAGITDGNNEKLPFVPQEAFEWNNNRKPKEGTFLGLELNLEPGDKNSNWKKAVDTYEREGVTDENIEFLIDNLPLNLIEGESSRGVLFTKPTKGELDTYNNTSRPLRTRIVKELKSGKTLRDISVKIVGQKNGILQIAQKVNNKVVENNILDLFHLQGDFENVSLSDFYAVNELGELVNAEGKKFKYTVRQGYPLAPGEIYLAIPTPSGKVFPLKLNVKRISEEQANGLYELYSYRFDEFKDSDSKRKGKLFKEIPEESLNKIKKHITDDILDTIADLSNKEVNNLTIKDVIDFYIWDGSKNTKTQVRFTKDGLLVGGKTLSEGYFKSEEGRNEFIGFLTDDSPGKGKRVNIQFKDGKNRSLHFKNAKYVKYLLASKTLNTNAVVGKDSPTFKGDTSVYLDTNIFVGEKKTASKYNEKRVVKAKKGSESNLKALLPQLFSKSVKLNSEQDAYNSPEGPRTRTSNLLNDSKNKPKEKLSKKASIGAKRGDVVDNATRKFFSKPYTRSEFLEMVQEEVENVNKIKSDIKNISFSKEAANDLFDILLEYDAYFGEKNFTIFPQEIVLWNEIPFGNLGENKGLYAGTTDLLAYDNNTGDWIIIDIKSSSTQLNKIYNGQLKDSFGTIEKHQFQQNAYVEMFEQITGKRPKPFILPIKVANTETSGEFKNVSKTDEMLLEVNTSKNIYELTKTKKSAKAVEKNKKQKVNKVVSSNKTGVNFSQKFKNYIGDFKAAANNFSSGPSRLSVEERRALGVVAKSLIKNSYYTPITVSNKNVASVHSGYSYLEFNLFGETQVLFFKGDDLITNPNQIKEGISKANEIIQSESDKISQDLENNILNTLSNENFFVYLQKLSTLENKLSEILNQIDPKDVYSKTKIPANFLKYYNEELKLSSKQIEDMKKDLNNISHWVLLDKLNELPKKSETKEVKVKKKENSISKEEADSLKDLFPESQEEGDFSEYDLEDDMDGFSELTKTDNSDKAVKEEVKETKSTIENIEKSNMTEFEKFEALSEAFIDFPYIIEKSIEDNLSESDSIENVKKANKQIVKGLLEQGIAKEKIETICK